MPDSSKCFPLVRGRVMRVTRLNGCGATVLGPTSVATSDGFVTITLTPTNNEGTAIQVTNANGDLCINDTPSPRFQNYGVAVAFCNVNPDLYTMMTGQPIVMDRQATPQGVGFRVNSGTNPSDSGFSLETWSAVPSVACEVGAESAFGYFLLPFVQGGTFDALTIGNDAVSFTITGALTKDGSQWGVGPYDVVRDAAGLPDGLAVAIDSQDHLHMEYTTVAPPTPVCGGTALGVPATMITAGIPSTLAPANSYAPGSLATMGAVGKTPATAWTTGQYVLLRDGTLAHWTGSAWAAGAA